MGYYTRFTLEVINGDASLIQEFREECDEVKWALTERGDSNQAVKWYEIEEDMKKFSLKHPEIIFKVDAEGEEVGDMWRWYFKNGKSQYSGVTFVFEPYDEDKLK